MITKHQLDAVHQHLDAATNAVSRASEARLLDKKQDLQAALGDAMQELGAAKYALRGVVPD